MTKVFANFSLVFGVKYFCSIDSNQCQSTSLRENVTRLIMRGAEGDKMAQGNVYQNFIFLEFLLAFQVLNQPKICYRMKMFWSLAQQRHAGALQRSQNHLHHHLSDHKSCESGHGQVMKKQLFHLYKLLIVHNIMDAYFIS